MNSPRTAIVTLLETSDLHGHIYPTDYRGPEDKPIGLAKLSAIIRKERSIDPSLLLIDNGDLLQGTPLMYHYAKYGAVGTHPAADALNALRYDAAVIGNHEFNYGPDLLKQTVLQSDCPWLSANIVNEADGQPAFGQPYRIFTLPAGIRIAVLGVTTHYIPNWENPNHIRGLTFEDALESATRWVRHIHEHERPDALVVCYHGGLEHDPVTGEPTEPLTGENQGYEMCKRIGGMDVLFTGHQHRLLAGEISGVAFAQPGFAGQAIAKVQLTFEQTAEGTWSLRGKKASLLLTADAEEQADEELLARFAANERQTQQWLDQPIGSTEGDLSITEPFAARQADHPFTEFINRVQMETTGAAISCAAIFTDEARGFGKRITMRDVTANYIYPNTLKVVLLTGREIREALEQSASYFDRDARTGELRVSAAYLLPKPRHFDYDMWEGIEYALDISQPVGERVVKLRWNDAPIDPEASFEVAMNSYRAGGGGNFDMIKGRPVVREIPTDMTEILADCIMKRGTIRSECDHNWIVY
ncbi:2',3'-cyclic-nucleotide 2'-phosphodiesterase/3'-nucleotidase [Paenibacillus cellulosilyticus]|uniref:2',3'-cyclic-nucleotide 2'-phosphodiesterase/3'-nucleotidase n=1 Tax=Paenibacillus cellulosilyticus TaxID=375489 RepID=A0A2V2YWR3_9BACL|nr:bifunctional metallophosphatase/5'-nucleotidase [Paenibacillus cellulosilyticus]PWW05196.1 2',3'-cyclic-nucleotide 2'-phosphodiesterase/3'-nucleotidase [Paenibacillus cellulosilyticus]QKS43521.1 5'-nucleotidase C-terminal domain-containing protein [Paenibacillus cellulosilyticus]